MGLKAPEQAQTKFKKPETLEEGTYQARVVRIIDYGIQPQRPFKGEEKAPAHEIGVTYELSDEFMKDDEGNDLEDKPRWISETFVLYPRNADLAKSTKRLNAIDPSNSCDGDWSKTLGLPCNVTIVVNQGKDGKEYENVGNVTTVRPKDAAKMPELKNPSAFFDLTEPDLEFFKSLPKWIQEKITSNLGFAGSPLEKLLSGGKGEDTKPAKKAAKTAPEVPAEDSEDAPW